ncbi:3-ketoacyl-ACP reductase [Roseovarius sp. 2305UL8-3]|uniref:3-ketoacyl-ACP reductase n=1 Tax=Roseovarius conchicola TaxID=3121636 RepID=UPI0035279A05
MKDQDMSEAAKLHDRLDALAKQLAGAREKLSFKKNLKDGHHLSSGEMKARYAFLKSEIDGEISDLEAHGHHVNALEQDVMTWLKAVDIDS